MCRSLFKHPARAMWNLAFMRHYTKSLELELSGGQVVRLQRPYLSHWFWDHVLTPNSCARLQDRQLRFRIGNTDFDLPVSDEAISTATAVGQHLPSATSVTWDEGLIRIAIADQQVVVRAGSMTDWYVANEILVHDEYSLASLPSNLDTVVDCGANIGVFSACVGARARRVVLLEPVADNLRLARKNLELAGVREKASFEEAALGADSAGTLTLKVYKDAQGNNSALADHKDRFGESEEIRVPTISIEDLFRKHDVDVCDLLKCDIEGGEYDAFENVPESVLARIQRIRMEYHLFDSPDLQERFKNLRKRLEGSGFRVAATDPLTPDGKPSGVTYLAATRIPDEALVMPTGQSL